MTAEETKAILTVSLLAAFVDGNKHEREREEIRKIAQGLTGDEGIHLPSLYQDVLMKRVSISDAVRSLTSSEAKQLAYEMAVCVCDADGKHSPAEEQFLNSLRAELGLDAGSADAFMQTADALSEAPLDAGGVAPAIAANASDDAELDRMILNAAILNGALELLPESLSTMAIVPLQMKLVYRIGKAKGFELTESSANFIFMKHPEVDGAKIYEAMKRRGVLIRHFTKPRMAQYNRVTIGSREQMDIFLKVLGEVIEELK